MPPAAQDLEPLSFRTIVGGGVWWEDRGGWKGCGTGEYEGGKRVILKGEKSNEKRWRKYQRIKSWSVEKIFFLLGFSIAMQWLLFLFKRIVVGEGR